MNITLDLYNLIWNFLFSGELPATLQTCATELCTLFTIIGIAVAVLLPLMLVYGFIKYIWSFTWR